MTLQANTVYAIEPAALKETLVAALGDKARRIDLALGEVTVLVTADTTLRVDFTYEFTGSVQGTVRSSTGATLAGVQVCDERGNCGTSNASGIYTWLFMTSSSRRQA